MRVNEGLTVRASSIDAAFAQTPGHGAIEP